MGKFFSFFPIQCVQIYKQRFSQTPLIEFRSFIAMVNKPCSRACTRTAVSSRLPSTYRSRSAGSLPNKRRPSQGHNYAQYLFGNNVDESEFIRELQRPAVIQVNSFLNEFLHRCDDILFIS